MAGVWFPVPGGDGVAVKAMTRLSATLHHHLLPLLLVLLLLPSLTRGLGSKQHSHRNASTVIMSDEQRLYRKLMKNYEKSVRPVINASTPVVINLGLTLTQIIDMDEKNQVLTVNIWLDQEWEDAKLKWNPKHYGGLTKFRIPCDSIWLPDIVLYNSVDDYTEPYMRSLAWVTNDGTVFWPPIVRFRSTCKVDITYFPFDDQICHMKMGSWAYDGFQVDVKNMQPEADLSNYVDNGEWTLVEARAVRNVVRYPCCPEPFPDVTFWFHLRRRTTYYTFNVIIPCVMLSILTLAGFLLPAQSGEKVSLGLTVLLAFSVFMLLIAENMPATSEFVPLMGIYLTVIMAMTSMSVVFSVFILHLHHHGGKGIRAPHWLRKLALHILARVVRVRTKWTHTWNEEPQAAPSRMKSGFGSFNEGFQGKPASPAPPMKAIFRMENGQVRLHQTVTGSSMDNAHHVDNCQPPVWAQVERELLRYLRAIMDRQDKDDVERHLVREWQEIAVVFDRLLFWLFFSLTFFSTVSLLVLRPMAKDIHLGNDTMSAE